MHSSTFSGIEVYHNGDMHGSCRIPVEELVHDDGLVIIPVLLMLEYIVTMVGVDMIRRVEDDLTTTVSFVESFQHLLEAERDR